MKKLLFLALIGLILFSCKKDQAQPATTSTDSLRVTVNSLSGGSTYSLSGSIDNHSMLSVVNYGFIKTYSFPIKSGQSFIFNWTFNKLGIEVPQLTISYQQKTIYTSSSSVRGSYVGVIP